jgi:hypothetical protein
MCNTRDHLTVKIPKFTGSCTLVRELSRCFSRHHHLSRSFHGAEGARVIFELHNNKAVHSTNRDLSFTQNFHDLQSSRRLRQLLSYHCY